MLGAVFAPEAGRESWMARSGSTPFRRHSNVVFADTDDARMRGDIDVLVRIVENADPNIDLFATRTIMVFEEALSLYAKSREEEPHVNE